MNIFGIEFFKADDFSLVAVLIFVFVIPTIALIFFKVIKSWEQKKELELTQKVKPTQSATTRKNNHNQPSNKNFKPKQSATIHNDNHNQALIDIVIATSIIDTTPSRSNSSNSHHHTQSGYSSDSSNDSGSSSSFSNSDSSSYVD
jgi:flagellar basal body L-ring protein FlgH